MPRPFSPKSRAEAIAAPLEDVRKAAAEDPRYLHGLAVIVADLIAPAEATEPAPPNETPAARAIREGKNRFAQMQRRVFEQVANRGAA